MSSQILEETWDPDIARQIIEVAPAIRALADTPEQLDETADEYDRLKPDATWDTDTLERHLVAQEFLSTFVSDDALAGTAAAQDIRNAYRQLPDPVRAAGSSAGWTPAAGAGPASPRTRGDRPGGILSRTPRRRVLRLRCEQRAFAEDTAWQEAADSPVSRERRRDPGIGRGRSNRGGGRRLD